MPELVEVLTYLDGEQATLFNRIKRRSFEPWIFVGRGEWSQSPYHQGDLSLYVSCNKNRTLWRAMVTSFGKRVVAVARTQQEISVEQAAAAMFQAVKRKDGEYVELLDAGDDLNFDAFWGAYRGRGDVFSDWAKT